METTFTTPNYFKEINIMAIEFNKTFGTKSTAAAAKDERPKSQFWLNIGYETDVVDDNGENRFVSLATGIPLDNMERLATNSRNKEFAAFQSARNDLYDQIMVVAKSLSAGEAKIIGVTDSGLAIQIRRINNEAAEIPVDQNQFAKKLVF